MTKTNYTPGPWKKEDLESVYPCLDIFGINNKRVCEIKAFQGVNFNDPSPKEAMYNAKLIAAAPELLEALELLAFVDVKDKESYKSALEKAFSIIKKSTE